MRTPVPNHKYKVGQVVWFAPGRQQHTVAAGNYKITRLLPADGTDYQYRIKNSAEPYERTARESQLSYRSIT
jgi:hypothetical protein